MRALVQRGKQIEEGVELVILQGMDTEQVFAKQLYAGWNGVCDLSS